MATQSHGISLWLVPSIEADHHSTSPTERLSMLIGRLAHANETPVFAPHVTLHSRLPLETDISSLVDTIRGVIGTGPAPSELVFRDVREGGTVFQCVLAAIEPDKSLSGLHDRLRAALQPFGLGDQADYFPHLSLVYGDLTSAHKLAIVQEIMVQDETLASDGTCRLCGMSSFALGELQVVRTASSDPSEWQCLARLAL
ncbi:uncharacterized protein L969DRAFT_88973 [Mixia osmundae IAM 14324]|uniref:2',3'-cyclic-nucleotide 3'-phosphodiesterase n=1 Tax=Mixia osmundae (strain CBS 9802 / IAM 14324 / JCM 22182 / KY 12970) TaxID=764103 RepID=G7E7W7_MIXOS|nr:uncharacterized protein L969DRAFT_88973 [Mixia osmundae IAM 14324]KEI38528.1 hypothetical protein L969DRAFT_88973 [Mixia osmundae IAM 14324]GAA98927.1 hypothetical protein E5Q_05615 [Mixia osmundae IAM 14324]